MKTWSVYRPTDGLFTGQIISGPSSALEENLPPTMRAIEGRYDRICQRFDIDTGAVVDYRPPQPHEDYEWRAENPDSVDRVNQRWRWVKKPEVLEIEQSRAQALARIEELERVRSQRAERDLLLAIAEQLGMQENDSYVRLKAIAQEIDSLRPDLLDRPR